MFKNQNNIFKAIKKEKTNAKKPKVECELLGLATLPICLQEHVKDYCPPKAPGNIPYDIWEKVKEKDKDKLEAIITKDNWNTERITHDGRGGLAYEFVLNIDVVTKNKKILDAIVKNRIRIRYKYPSRYEEMDLSGRITEINNTYTAIKLNKGFDSQEYWYSLSKVISNSMYVNSRYDYEVIRRTDD